MTETDIINTVAADYVQAELALGNPVAPTDCTAQPLPAEEGWLLVKCRPNHLDADQFYEYRADRWGRLVRLDPY